MWPLMQTITLTHWVSDLYAHRLLQGSGAVSERDSVCATTATRGPQALPHGRLACTYEVRRLVL